MRYDRKGQGALVADSRVHLYLLRMQQYFAWDIGSYSEVTNYALKIVSLGWERQVDARR